jgi:hypothetical protein
MPEATGSRASAGDDAEQALVGPRDEDHVQHQPTDDGHEVVPP